MSSLDGRTNGGSRVANERLRELMETPPEPASLRGADAP